jgi:cytochrome c oxidase subunit 3
MSDHGHGNPHIQHHYDDGKHQFDSGKLGIWVFLAQEILFFSALFVAYIIYRTHHPEIFAYAHHYLDTNMGALNTGVLILSSLTAAWAVRAAQLNQRKLLVFLLSVTIACAFGFLIIKYFEYSHKIHIGVLYGGHFNPTEAPDGTPLTPKGADTPDAPAAGDAKPADGAGAADADAKPTGEAAPAGAEEGADQEDPLAAKRPPPNTGMFFTIYFCMTGLHGIHVLLGIFVFIWLLVRAHKGHFSDEYFGPVDYAALYWHLVDLIWIYLFPLLYLIH